MKILDFRSIKEKNVNVIQSVTKHLKKWLSANRKYDTLLDPTKPHLQMLISAVS